ncbi:MAG: hypothetical protein HZB38_15085 [Planctomycetes bacterium]|nr:hypothetical protein [Planctomycetota bacterium]
MRTPKRRSRPIPLCCPLHNRAAAEFKLGDYATARDLWVRAASLRDPRFEAQTIFNLGNCSYQEALDLVRTPAAPLAGGDAAAAGTSIDKPIELLDHAIERYRDALRLDPSLTDARANLELADQLKKKLRESAQSQPQSQSQPSSQTQSQPGSQPSQQQNGQGEKQPSSQPQSQPQSQPSQDKQDQQGQNSDQDKEQNPQSQPQQNEDDQMPPESQPSEPQSRPASRPQSQPQPQPSPESQPSEGQAEQQPEQLMSQAEFERLLQKVRDAERLRRLKLRQAEAARQRPVEKDW